MRIVWRLAPQQLGDRVGSALMDSRANRHLHGFQIQLAALASVVEDPLELLL
jgi:hypothetical protein